MITERLTASPAAAAALADAKAHLRVDFDDDDAEIARFIGAAQRELELYSGLAITRQTIRITKTGWPADGLLNLPIGPVEIGPPAPTVTADGEAASVQMIAGTRPRLLLSDPEDYAAAEIVAEYVAGFETPPDDLVTAVIDQAGVLYDARALSRIRSEAEGGISAHAARIVARYRGVAL